jgi:outer membrane cobalamin receptor
MGTRVDHGGRCSPVPRRTAGARMNPPTANPGDDSGPAPAIPGRRAGRPGAWLAGLTLVAAALRAAPPAPVAPPDSAGVVTLPPYELDAVEPPWATDTRTASTSVFFPASDAMATLADSLRAYPGLQVDQPGGPGGRSSLYLRGGEENYTIVLLDGVPVNNGTDSRGGGFDFGTLDADEFSSVQIVRGPVSARYGPEALAGVIKLTSDVLGPPGGSVAGIGAGSHGEAQAYAGTSAQQGGMTAAASVHWSQDGRRADGNFARHEAVAAGVTGQGRRMEWRASVRYGWTDSAAFPDDSGGSRLAVLRSLEERWGSTTTAALELLSPEVRSSGVKWRLRTWGAWLHAHDNSPGVAPGLRDPAGLPASLEATTLQRLGFAAEGAVDVGATATLAAGVDGQSEDGRSDASLIYGPVAFPGSFAAIRERIGAFGDYTWRPAAGWLIEPSVRVDAFRHYGARLTPRLGIRIPVAADTVLRMNAGTGFKPPSFYAVSNPLVGNPALRPEQSQTVDAGIERQLGGGRGTLELGAFSSRYRDGIDFDPGPPPRLVNRSRIRSDGLEASLRLRAGDALELDCTGTYADVRSEPGGGRLRGRPRPKGAVRATLTPLQGIAIAASLVAVGRVLDSSVPTGDVLLPDWHRLDLSARLEVRRGVSVMAGIENVLNARYEEAVGVPSPGVRWRGGLEARF